MGQNKIIVEKLAVRFETLRPRLLKVAEQFVETSNAEDVVQIAYMRLAKNPLPVVPGDSYIFQTVKNATKDACKKKRLRREQPLVEELGNNRGDSDPFDAEIVADPESALRDLSSLERRVWAYRVKDQRRYADIAILTNRSCPAVRKVFQRSRAKVAARLFTRWLSEGQYDTINSLRLKQSQSIHIARLCGGDAACIDSLFEILRHKEWNKAIKNATLVLSHLLPCARQVPNRVQELLVQILNTAELYRGQKMYIVEALLDANYRRHVYRFGRDFLDRMHEMEDRPASRTLTKNQMNKKNPLDIFDVKDVTHIGRDIREHVVKRLCAIFESGEGTADYRRCLGFQLQRLHWANEDVLRSLVRGLYVEPDQMNAIYTVKHIRKRGLLQHPSLFRDAANAIERVAKRWPKNVYLSSSLRAVAEMSF